MDKIRKETLNAAKSVHNPPVRTKFAEREQFTAHANYIKARKEN